MSDQPQVPPVPDFGRFFLPGPTEVRPEILAAQIGPMIGHRGGEMESLMARIQPGLRALFRTERPVYVSASSATGLMEAAIRNGVRRRVLCLVNGAFSDRFFRIAAACGYDADPLAVGWGEPHTPEMVAEALARADYDAVTVVHSETSTGVLDPIRELAAVARDAGDVVLLVDSVSGLGGTPVETAAWEIDCILTGSQKALALPPGLALAVATPRILARAGENPRRGIYFDFLEFERNLEKNQTPNTPAVSLMYALAAQLDRILAEGVEARWARHEAMARRTWEWAARLRDAGAGVDVLAPEGYRSPTVTCIRLDSGWTGTRICAEMESRGYVIAPGYGKAKDEMIRIGHMGDHTLDELEALLAELEDVLTSRP